MSVVHAALSSMHDVWCTLGSMHQGKGMAKSGWRGEKTEKNGEICEQRKRKEQQRQAMRKEKQRREQGKIQKQGGR